MLRVRKTSTIPLLADRLSVSRCRETYYRSLVCFVLCVGGSLLFYRHVRSSSHAEMERTQRRVQALVGAVSNRARLTEQVTTPQVANTPKAEDPLVLTDPFFRIIIENNLFAPLGTAFEAPPRYTRYRLLGTLMHTRACSTHAILLETTTHTVRRVHEGDTLDGGTLTVTQIQPKQVRLTDTNGHARTLELEPHLWLGPR